MNGIVNVEKSAEPFLKRNSVFDLLYKRFIKLFYSFCFVVRQWRVAILYFLVNVGKRIEIAAESFVSVQSILLRALVLSWATGLV